jgi:hypothetical protein
MNFHATRYHSSRALNYTVHEFAVDKLIAAHLCSAMSWLITYKRVRMNYKVHHDLFDARLNVRGFYTNIEGFS